MGRTDTAKAHAAKRQGPGLGRGRRRTHVQELRRGASGQGLWRRPGSGEGHTGQAVSGPSSAEGPGCSRAAGTLQTRRAGLGEGHTRRPHTSHTPVATSPCPEAGVRSRGKGLRRLSHRGEAAQADGARTGPSERVRRKRKRRLLRRRSCSHRTGSNKTSSLMSERGNTTQFCKTRTLYGKTTNFHRRKYLTLSR